MVFVMIFTGSRSDHKYVRYGQLYTQALKAHISRSWTERKYLFFSILISFLSPFRPKKNWLMAGKICLNSAVLAISIYTDFSKTGANLTLPNVLSHSGDSLLIVRKVFIEVHFFDYHNVIL